MIDPVIERQYSDCRELIALWKAFSEYFSIGVKGDNLTPEKEGQFLQLKSRIAELHDSFMDALTHDQNVGQSMLDVVSRSITLKHLNRLSTADVKKMEIEWHESYLLLNDTIGALDDKRNELAKVSETQFRSKKAAGALQQKVVGFFTSGGFKLLLILGAVAFVTVGVQALGIWDWDTVGKWKGFEVPYRWGKGLVRKAYNPESEWPTIASAPRKPYASWPSGLKEPEVKSNDRNDLMKVLPPSLPPDIREALSKSTEYQMERTSREFKGEAFLHSLLLPTTSDAKKAEESFKAWAETPNGKNAVKKFRLFRDFNVVRVINSDNPDMVRELAVYVFEQPDSY